MPQAEFCYRKLGTLICFDNWWGVGTVIVAPPNVCSALLLYAGVPRCQETEIEGPHLSCTFQSSLAAHFLPAVSPLLSFLLPPYTIFPASLAVLLPFPKTGDSPFPPTPCSRTNCFLDALLRLGSKSLTIEPFSNIHPSFSIFHIHGDYDLFNSHYLSSTVFCKIYYETSITSSPLGPATHLGSQLSTGELKLREVPLFAWPLSS